MGYAYSVRTADGKVSPHSTITGALDRIAKLRHRGEQAELWDEREGRPLDEQERMLRMLEMARGNHESLNIRVRRGDVERLRELARELGCLQPAIKTGTPLEPSVSELVRQIAARELVLSRRGA